MITAADAKTLYDQSGVEVDKYLHHKIEHEIKAAATSGNRTVFHFIGARDIFMRPPRPDPLQTRIIEKLRALGYTVQWLIFLITNGPLLVRMVVVVTPVKLARSMGFDWTNIYFPFTEYRRVYMDFLDHELNFVERYRNNDNDSINFDSLRDVESRAPILEMEFKDYDGTVVKATARFTRSKYRLGTKWAKFLGYLVPSKTYHHIEIQFDQEVGPEKGSWKGGTMGITTQRFPEESARDCMIRVCEGEGLTLLPQ